MSDRPTRRIGIFDSGIGGLSVWRAIVARRPGLPTVYVADHAHLPYGERLADEVRAFARGITRFLVEAGCDLVVVACNSASAAALEELRRDFPDVRFVGMEPAVKPAAAMSRSGIVGVLATPQTLAGELFNTTVARYAGSVRVLAQPCPGFVELVEAGDVAGERARDLVRQRVEPLVQAGADVLVLGCTHYPFLRDAIGAVAGPGVQLLDPADAVARQVMRLLDEPQPTVATQSSGEEHDAVFWSTRPSAETAAAASACIGRELTFRTATWRAGNVLVHAEQADVVAPRRRDG